MFSYRLPIFGGIMTMETHPKKLLDQLRDTIRQKNYSDRTEQAYTDIDQP